MTRRTFVEAGLSGAALLLAQRESHAQLSDPDLSITVIGVEGSDLTVDNVQDYMNGKADVWQLSDNVVDFDTFQATDGINAFVENNPSIVALAKSYSDILAAKKAGKVAIVVGCQEFSALDPLWQGNTYGRTKVQDWTVNPPQTYLSEYYELGLRIANPAYNLSNFFGGGCLDPTTPLSKAGRYMVDQMQDMGILVDCTHSGIQTSLDVMWRAKRPVVCSHSNPTGIVDNVRNVSDRQIDGIAKTGGLIGVNAVSAFYTWSIEDGKDTCRADYGPFPPIACISSLVDAIDYIKARVGIDYIGIGPDWGAGTYKSPLPTKSYIYPPDMTYAQTDGIQYLTRFGDVTDLPNLRTELKNRHYSNVDIAKVLGGNWMRVFRNAWNS